MKTKKNILVLTYWNYSEPLVQIYTLPYLRLIRDILPEGANLFLVTLEKENASLTPKKIEKGIFYLSFPYIPFGIRAIFAWRKNISFLKKFILKNEIQTIHTWCTPAGAIGYFLSKKTGIPLILDSYEPHAEPMVETGTWKKNGIAFKILFRLEKKQTHHAKYLIGVVKGMKKYAKEKYNYEGDNFFVKPACVDLNQFELSKRKDPELLEQFGYNGKIVCVYSGKLGGLYLSNEMFLFFKYAVELWGERFRILILTSVERKIISEFCRNNDIDPKIVHSLFVLPTDMPKISGLADFAFSAFKPVPSRKYCTPIKNGEYWAMGLPVIIPKDISEDSEIIASTQTGVVLRDFSGTELKNAVLKIDQLITENRDGKLSEKIHELAVKHRNFKIAEEVYKKIYGS